jgi:ribosome modulation factor
MTSCRVPPAPVSQQVPPARTAACNAKALRGARGSLLLTTGMGSRRDTSPDWILKLDERAWEKGYRAGRLGISDSTGPYHPRSLKALSWISGYIEGKAARNKLVLDARRKY